MFMNERYNVVKIYVLYKKKDRFNAIPIKKNPIAFIFRTGKANP
jgi:hypothetical protein